MNRALRVAMVTPGYPPDAGGVEVHTGALATELRALGVDVRVLTARRGLASPRSELVDGVPVRAFPALATTAVSASARLVGAGLAAFVGADLVHVHGYHAASAVSALTGFAAPVVLTPHYHGGGHTPVAELLHTGYRYVGRGIVRAARAVICVSEAERSALVADMPGAAPRTVVIPNGVHTAELAAAAPWPGERPTVLALGRLEPYKGVARLVAAAGRLPRDAQVVVIGEGSQREELETLAALNGVGDRVRILGALPTADVRRWLRTARVLVSLSAHEAFGMAPVEAVAAGARVVLTDIPAHREIVADHLGPAAELVPLGAGTEEVAAAVTAALTAPPPSDAHVPDWADIARRTAEVYEAALTRTPIRASTGPAPTPSAASRRQPA
jgi:glycosyltransferase involved in cell wall biosynthesis